MEQVQSHYAAGPDLTRKIRAGLETLGKTPENITPRDLAAVDQLHTGGAPATIALVRTWKEKISPPEVPSILDAGCGTGGSARLLAEQFSCRVTGIDLSGDFIETARALTAWCGLEDRASFSRASVLDLKFEEESFDAVLCQHILMNVSDKARALKEFFRVLRPGGSLILHEITRGSGPEPAMPVPWAADETISFLVTWDELSGLIEREGFAMAYSADETEASAQWWRNILHGPKKSKGRPALHPGLVFGKNAALFGPNMEKNFSSKAVLCMGAIYKKT